MLKLRSCVALAVLVIPIAALAQKAQPSSANSTLQVTSRIVYVDVVVRDSAGNIVRGLTAKDFQLMEDGKPQKVEFFADHTNDFSRVAETPASKLQFSNVGPVSNSVNIILFDFSNTAPLDMLYARKQMIRFLEALPPGHQTALFVLGKRLYMLQNFTGSTERLIAAAKSMKLKSSVMNSTGSQQQEVDFVAAFNKAVGSHNPSGHSMAADGLFLQTGDEAQQSIDITRNALNEIAAAVSGYPGRKNLYWLADRFPLYGGPALEIHELATDITQSIMSTQDMTEADQGLADAQIAIYPVLLTGVDASGMGSEARGITGMGAVPNDPTTFQQASTQDDRRQLQGVFFQRAALYTMMNNLANTTGGHAYYGTNDLAGALRKGFEDGSSYYTLAYVPRNTKWNGAFRKIKVAVEQHGDSLSYRRGYYAVGSGTETVDPAQELDTALQPATPASTMLRLRSSVTLPDNANPYITIKTRMGLDGIDLSTDAAGLRHGKLLVILVALNQDGKQPGNPPQASGVLNLDFTPQQYQAVLKAGIEFALRMRLKPGSYRLRLGVTDMNNRRLGTLDMPVTVP